MKLDAINQIDFYKANHRPQYPKGTELVYSNLTARSTRHLAQIKGTDDKIVFFGLQFFVKDFLIDLFNDTFFDQPKDKVVARYKRRMDTSLGVDSVNVEHIAALHDLGYLPVSIRALPEGAAINVKVPFLTIENTLPEFFWLTNYLETIISNYLWKPITSATIARKYKQLLTNYAIETGAPLEFVPFQGHDFSMRGMSGLQDAVTSGAGHLLSFVGTDTVPAIDFLEDYYNADAEKELIGCSVPATEHSVMCMGMKDGEFETFKRLITEIHPKGIVSIVSDTWDFWSVVNPDGGILARLKDTILSREGKVVIRPDSGDPVKIICGDIIEDFTNKYWIKDEKSLKGFIEYYIANSIEEATLDGECRESQGTLIFKYQGKIYKAVAKVLRNDSKLISLEETILTNEQKGLIECLWEIFGGTETDKGFKVLDSHIGAIYGDSITLERANAILSRLKAKGFAANNIVFGIGSFTYEYQTRDTLGTAMKATAGIVNGEFREIFKDPKTDAGAGSFKKSAKGYLQVVLKDGEFTLINQVSEELKNSGELKEVFRDGELKIDLTLTEIRSRIEISIKK